METLDTFTQENVCETCIHDRYGCSRYSGMTAGWDDKGNGIIVACEGYTKDTPEEEKQAQEWMRRHGITPCTINE